MSSEMQGFSVADGGVVAPVGFSASGVSCGIKAGGRKDLALVVADSAVPAAAVFTTNSMAAAPVELSRAHMATGTARAVIINAGNANACTGAQGAADALATAHAAAGELECAPEDVVVCSTGVIGVPLPVETLVAGIPMAVEALDRRSGDDAAEAIMTTDTFAKQCAVAVTVGGRTVTVGGMAKGSGMIAPNMATMLAVVTTDAALSSAACDTALRAAANQTFNRVTVDGDTSTNDTLVLMASGAAGGPLIEAHSQEYALVAHAIQVVCAQLATMIARDGEGATKLVTITVSGAVDEAQAQAAAHSIANSLLVKTALFGNDANWGRVAMALGNSGAHIDPGKVSIRFAGIEVCTHGEAVPFDEDEAFLALDNPEVTVDVDLGVGAGTATVLTCDLSYEYVRINGEYRS